MLRDILHDGTVVRPLERQHDLRSGRQIILHAHRRFGQRGVFDDLQDVAMIGQHAGKILRTHAQHIEQGFGLVEIGDRRRQHGPQRIAHLARPLALPAHDKQLVGGALRRLEPRTGRLLESVAPRCHDGNQRRETEKPEYFHRKKRYIVKPTAENGETAPERRNALHLQRYSFFSFRRRFSLLLQQLCG